MLNLDQLLAPIHGEQPCGADLAFSSEIDAIQRARQADDPSIEQGAWVTDLKEADWKFVAKQCAQLIETRSKDLRLAVWLAEASARTGGLRGLGDSLLLVAMLCERWWDGLYPLPDEGGVEQRIGNLAWVAARTVQWLRDVPLTAGPDALTLRDVDAARGRGDEGQARIVAARKRGAPAFHAGLADDACHCRDAVARLERVVDERLGADGPSFAAVRGALDDVDAFLRTMVPQAQPAANVPIVRTDAVSGHAPADVAIAVGGNPLTRAEALAQLRAVAAYFRQTEPHSPVAYLADKAALWGEQPLHVWLRTVIKDDASFAHVEELLGVGEKR